MPTKVISVYNLKGGTGKTFIAHALTAYLSFKGYKVLAIDLDQQANFSISLVEPKEQLTSNTNATISALFYPEKYKDDPKKLIMSSYIPNVDVLASNLSLAALEVAAYTIPRPNERVKLFIDSMPNNYDYVIIDNPPAFNIFTTNSFVASDYIVVPLFPSTFAIDGLEQVVRMLERMMDFTELFIAAIIPNMIDKRYKAHQYTLKYLHNVYGSYTTKPIGRRSEYQKILDGKISLYKAFNNPSEDIKNLMEVLDEVLEKINILEQKKAGAGGEA